jgi:hypothetical protein
MPVTLLTQMRGTVLTAKLSGTRLSRERAEAIKKLEALIRRLESKPSL